MNKWIPIALIGLFLIAYQVFVITPHQRAKIEAQKAALATGAVSGLEKETPVQKEGASISDDRGAVPSINLTLGKEIHTFALGPQVNVRAVEGGGLKSATFENYRVRGIEERKATEILPDGAMWFSTNSLVQACLSKMTSVCDGAKCVFSAQHSPQTRCSIELSMDASRANIVRATVKLEGFTFEKGREGHLILRGLGRLGEGNPMDHNGLMFVADQSKQRIKDGDVFENQIVQGKIDWLLWGDRYFATAFLPVGKYNPDLRYGAEDPESVRTGRRAFFSFEYPIRPDNGIFLVETELFFGTRDVDSLMAARAGLEEAVDFGWFPWISKVLLKALVAIYSLVGNYGVAIIILTLLVRIVFWPLNKKVYQSGLKMKALQPEVEKLKKKYGDDKSKQQQMGLEMMGLYKKHGVNPVGSCLPLLAQMPIFFGLYGALNHSMELFQAPFFGWIQDLSWADPFYVLPVVWTLSLIAYVFINPQPTTTQPGMPDMRWIMIAMNLFIGYLSKDWPAGLNLYLVVSNLVGISQQLVMQRAAKKLQPIQEGV